MIAKISIAVPLIGYFILFNDGIVKYLHLNTAVCGGDSCEASWRLLFLYFAGCAYGLAGALYALYCPITIKSYSSAAEFLETEGPYFSNPRHLDYLLILTRDDGGKLTQSATTLFNQEGNFQRPLHGGELAEIMGNYFLSQNYKRPMIGAFCLGFFRLGRVLILVPTLITFYQVGGVAMSRLASYASKLFI